jgi:exosome complex protein LRP1
MDNSEAADLLEELTSNIDALTKTLQPLLSQPIHTSASGLPLLETAKLYTLTTYAIESLLLAYERLHVASNPDEAHSHPIMAELKRVQHSMQKIAAAEKPQNEAEGRTMTVDKSAASRFVKAGLAMNNRYDEVRARREEEARMEAKRKFEGVNGERNDEKRKKKKFGKRSSESLLDVPEENLELVKGAPAAPEVEDTPKKEKSKKYKHKKSRISGEAT